jgi:hypothetical protein
MPHELTDFARGELLGIPNLFWSMAVIGVVLHFRAECYTYRPLLLRDGKQYRGDAPRWD